MTRYVIIGNGAAGATAAETLRELDPQGAITILSAEPFPMYSRPGLAYVLLNEIPARQVFARQPDWYRLRQIQLVFDRAIKVDAHLRRVHLAKGPSLPYDRLLIATGARAMPLPYPGGDLEGVVYLDTLAGTQDLLKQMRRARRAVVVGGGITALELAEGFAHHKLETHYLLRRARLWASVLNDAESQLLEAQMRAHGVQVHFNTEAAEVVGNARRQVTAIRLTNGTSLPCDLVGAGIGVRAQLEVAAEAGLRLDKGLVVDEFLATNHPDIFAAGDCAQAWNPWTQRHTLDVLWPTAVAQGRVAAHNMTGARMTYTAGVPFNACLLFGLHITAIGQLGGEREADEPEVVQHLSRGTSEVWASRPHAYASAWSQSGANAVRLAFSGPRLVGALVIGEQTLADALRFLVEKHIDLGPLRPQLDAGGPELARLVLALHQRLRTMPAAQWPVAA